MRILRYCGKCLEECLFYRLLKLLDEHGWRNLGLGAHIKSRRINVNGFQESAVRILVWNWCISRSTHIRGAVDHVVEYEGRKYKFILGRGDTRTDAALYQKVKPGCITREELIMLLNGKPKPLIVIDLSQFTLHNLDELGSLRRQLASTLGVIREYLWDRHLLLTSAPPGVEAWLRPFMASNFYQISSFDTDTALDIRGYRGSRILLDPNAEEDLKPWEVLEAEVFIIGGIVDKRPRPGATAELPVYSAIRRRISLRGSLIGLPNTINAIVETILRARYLYSGDVERALYDTIPPHEARIRAYVEISRYKRRIVTMEQYVELARWLPIRPHDFVKAARMAGVDVQVDSEKLLSKDQCHH